MGKRSVHLVYVKGQAIRTPIAITNELAQRLEANYQVHVYDWDEKTTIIPGSGDILLGHVHPDLNTIFNRSYQHPAWAKIIPLQPFSHGLPREASELFELLDCVTEKADRFLAICGKYWTQTIDQSIFSHWKSKTVQVDLAIRTDHFPFVKESFNPPGARKFVYIGHSMRYKGTDYFAKLAANNPNLQFSWIGDQEIKYPNIKSHGQLDFSQGSSLDIIKSHDFLLTCGRADANPTTILEAAAWGLIPVCTPQCGYRGEDWFFNIPLDDVHNASRILQRLNEVDEIELRKYQAAAQNAIATHYNWDRFAQQVVDAIEGEKLPSAPAEVWQSCRKRNQRRRRFYKLQAALKLIAGRVTNTIKRAGRAPRKLLRKFVRSTSQDRTQ